MAQGVRSFRFTRRFKKDYRGLPKGIQEAFDQKLELFLQDTSHRSLRIKRIQGMKNRWEGSVTMKYRFTFELSGDLVIFRSIGSHDILDRESD
jgi:mRNA interferase RelE/StbE